jgi:hypothetical protein
MVHAAADTGYKESPPVSPEDSGIARWIGFDASIGHYFRMWSIKEYSGYSNWAIGIFTEWESRPSSLFHVPISYAWNLKLKYQHLNGTVELVPAQVPENERTGGPYYVVLDHDQLALTIFRRFILYPEARIHPTLHLGLGASILSDKVLKEGTTYNYNILGGAGLEWIITDDLVGTLDIQWEHFSNGGKIGLTNDAVIGLESCQFVLGVRFQL